MQVFGFELEGWGVDRYGRPSLAY